MPKIDTYTATTTPVVPDQPFRFMETGQNPVSGLEQQSKLVGHQLGHIAGNILAQQDSVDFGLASSNYAAAPKQIDLDVRADPEVIQNPMLYQQKFNEKLQEYQRKLIEETPNERIHGAIQTLFEQRNPEIQFEARRQQLSLAADDNIAKLNVMADTNAKAAAQAIATGRPDEARRLSNEYSKSVMDAVINQHLTKEAAQKRILGFEVKRSADEMFIYADGNSASRDKMRELSRNGYFDNLSVEQHSAIMNHADRLDAAEQARLEATAKKNAQDDERIYWGLAETGELSQDVLQAIKENRTNVDPKVGHAIERYMNGPRTRERDPGVGYIAQEWGFKLRTLDNINGEKAALKAHTDANGYSEDARIRLDHLNSEYDRVRNTNFSQGNVQVNKLLQYVPEVVKSVKEPSLGVPWLEHQQRAVIEQITNEAQRKVREGDLNTQKEISDWVTGQMKAKSTTGGKDTRSNKQKSSDDFSREGR